MNYVPGCVNHDCPDCGDQGFVRGEYADEDGYEQVYCKCQIGQELEEQAARDIQNLPTGYW